MDTNQTPRFEVQTRLGAYNLTWENTWHDENDEPLTFGSRAEAQAELDDHLDSAKNAGMDYEPDDYRIILPGCPYHYNIPMEVAEYAYLAGLRFEATGGGMDYVEIPLSDGCDIILCDALDAGSPDALDAPAEILVMTSEWQSNARIFSGTAQECIDFMAKVEVYQ